MFCPSLLFDACAAGQRLKKQWFITFISAKYLFKDGIKGTRQHYVLNYFVSTPPDRDWQRNEGLLALHSFLFLDILVAFSIHV